MLEWLKRHAWKACIRQKRIPSSNLGHSAKKRNPASRIACGIFYFLLTSFTAQYRPSGCRNPKLKPPQPEGNRKRKAPTGRKPQLEGNRKRKVPTGRKPQLEGRLGRMATASLGCGNYKPNLGAATGSQALGAETGFQGGNRAPNEVRSHHPSTIKP